MKRFLLVILMTALGFAAGYGVRIWTECHPSLPSPPVAFLGEFAHPRPEPPPPARGADINRAELITRIQGIRDQLDAFQARKDEIDNQFDRDLDGVLNAEQRAKHAEAIKRRHTPHPPSPDDDKPLTDDKLNYLLREQPGRSVIYDVVLPWRLDNLTHDYKLDDAQREKVRALLRARREAFLALVDSSPPPSVTLYRLLPLVQRISQPGAPTPPPPKPAGQ